MKTLKQSAVKAVLYFMTAAFLIACGTEPKKPFCVDSGLDLKEYDLLDCSITLPESGNIVVDSMFSNSYFIFLEGSKELNDGVNYLHYWSGTSNNLPERNDSYVEILDTVGTVIRTHERRYVTGSGNSRIEIQFIMYDYATARYHIYDRDTFYVTKTKPVEIAEKVIIPAETYFQISEDKYYKAWYDKKVLLAEVDTSCVGAVYDIFYSIRCSDK